jgi:Ca2+-binding RTX toxin-like protein
LIIFLGITYITNASLIHVHLMQINMTVLKNTISKAQYAIFPTFVVLLLFLLSLPSSTLSEVIGGSVTGNGFKNYLFGTMVDDTIIGKEGNDRLYGLAGADKIFGDSGDDILQGDQGMIS